MRASSIGLTAVILLALALVGYVTVGPGARAAGENPDALSIDMDPLAAPANTCTPSPDGVVQGSCVLGTIEVCARMDENDVLDADEDNAADQLLVDVTILNVPESNPMIGIAFNMTFPDTSVRIAG